MNILFDFSQIVISSAMHYHKQTKTLIDENLLRHISMNSLLSYRTKFRADDHKMWVCCDGRDYWRKDIFPNYKKNRKKSRDKSDFDWPGFFKIFNKIKQEVANDLPYNTIEIDRCEADDVIAVLSQILCSSGDDITIVSSDKDFIQIQDMCPRVKQWSHFLKKYINQSTNSYNLYEHIARGDSDDGIPNILSEDDVFLVDGKRQKPISKVKLAGWMKYYSFEEMLTERGLVHEKFRRNRSLIDLSQIPDEYQNLIRQAYMNVTPSEKSVFDFLVKHKLVRIMETSNF